MQKPFAYALLLAAALGLAACDKPSEDKAQDAQQSEQKAQEHMNEAAKESNQAAEERADAAQEHAKEAQDSTNNTAPQGSPDQPMQNGDPNKKQ
jgi:Flp pilus assembly protein TadB